MRSPGGQLGALNIQVQIRPRKAPLLRHSHTEGLQLSPASLLASPQELCYVPHSGTTLTGCTMGRAHCCACSMGCTVYL